MGNKGNNTGRSSLHKQAVQMTVGSREPSPSTEILGENEVMNCCGIEFSRRSSRQVPNCKPNRAWKQNFDIHCQEIKPYYKWVTLVYDAYNVKEDIRTEALRDLQMLKYAFTSKKNNQISYLESEKPEQIRKTLQKSVIFPTDIKPERGRPRTSINTTHVTQGSKAVKQSILLKKQRKVTVGRMKRESLISFIDQKIVSLFQNEGEIDKESGEALSLFVSVTQLIEKWCDNQKGILYKIKMAFIGYLQTEYCHTFTESKGQEMAKDVTQFTKLYKETISDYFKIPSLEELTPNRTLFNQDNFTNSVTSILFKNPKLYRVIYTFYEQADLDREKYIQRLLKNKREVRPQDLGVKDQYCLNKKTVEWYVEKLSVESNLENMAISAILDYEPYESCIIKLRQIEQAKTPIAKLKVIVSSAQKITKSIKEFYKLNNLEIQFSMIDADQILSIFCYIVIASQIKNIFTHMKIIENFSTDNQLMAVTGYYFSVLMSSVQNLIQEDEKLSMKANLSD